MKIVRRFTTRFGDKQLYGDIYPAKRHDPILCIHGAGKSNRARFSDLRASLQSYGLESLSFDCLGHGDSEGDIGESSLASRTAQAEAVINDRNLEEPIVVFGTSMGAYNAITLTKTRKVKALVLIVPGVYAAGAYEIPFGPDFSKTIRQERSWEATDAWEILANFQGKLLVIAAEHDSVVPREIPERICASAAIAKESKLPVIKGAQHNHLFSILKETPPAYEALILEIIACTDG
jgi:pimeloyl-ACP methyl ester carboxylesterase